MENELYMMIGKLTVEKNQLSNVAQQMQGIIQQKDNQLKEKEAELIDLRKRMSEWVAVGNTNESKPAEPVSP